MYVERLNVQDTVKDTFMIRPETEDERALMTALYERTVLPMSKEYQREEYVVAIVKR